MKPLIRWTMSGVLSKLSFIILKHSVKFVKKLYPECDFVICCNQINEFQIKKIKELNVELYFQRDSDSLGFMPIPLKNSVDGVHWKLYPPRLRKSSHEIFIDNDIVLHKRVPLIDDFLLQDFSLVYEGLYRLLGNYDHHVPKGYKINSGIFGIPPDYDFEDCLRKKISTNSQWKDKFDEQGLVASVLLDYKNYQMIKQVEIPIIENVKWEPKVYYDDKKCCGFHFVGGNRTENHEGWNNYISYLKFKRLI